MNKKELVTAIAEHSMTEVSKQQAENVLNAFIDIIKDSLLNGDDLALNGFGTFTVRHRVERKGRNPRTGEVITIAACQTPAFKASKELKELINHKG
ncbi:integration host factor subunit alpha [Photobacterium phosphoreum]|uniref:HU family DNA-binding protein n=1 Tax=Photobacterium phosphoreum TaxID=659 RepID=UPI000D16CD77|nr:HU family DNA-binding protein [Photobacterium phosphoreum]PSW27627.1 integration host factor subunit alpha [Photobacterium phosphoreum]